VNSEASRADSEHEGEIQEHEEGEFRASEANSEHQRQIQEHQGQIQSIGKEIWRHDGNP
jgi:hypothetical protein